MKTLLRLAAHGVVIGATVAGCGSSSNAPATGADSGSGETRSSAICKPPSSACAFVTSSDVSALVGVAIGPSVPGTMQTEDTSSGAYENGSCTYPTTDGSQISVAVAYECGLTAKQTQDTEATDDMLVSVSRGVHLTGLADYAIWVPSHRYAPSRRRQHLCRRRAPRAHRQRNGIRIRSGPGPGGSGKGGRDGDRNEGTGRPLLSEDPSLRRPNRRRSSLGGQALTHCSAASAGPPSATATEQVVSCTWLTTTGRLRR